MHIINLRKSKIKISANFILLEKCIKPTYKKKNRNAKLLTSTWQQR